MLNAAKSSSCESSYAISLSVASLNAHANIVESYRADSVSSEHDRKFIFISELFRQKEEHSLFESVITRFKQDEDFSTLTDEKDALKLIRACMSLLQEWFCSREDELLSDDNCLKLHEIFGSSFQGISINFEIFLKTRSVVIDYLRENLSKYIMRFGFIDSR